MKASPIGRRYARALLELASEKGNVPKIRMDLENLSGVWNESEELRYTLENPAMNTKRQSKLAGNLLPLEALQLFAACLIPAQLWTTPALSTMY
mgnify:CR=1 FL=1